MTEPISTPVGLAKLLKAEDARTPPPIITVYGPGGVGKSTFASNFPAPLIIDSEHGLIGIKADSIPATNYQDVLQTIKDLHKDSHGYRTVALDTLDAMEPMLWAEACRRNGWQSIEDAGYGKGYVAAADLWRNEIIAGLQALRNRHGMTVIMTAHSQVKTFQSPLHDAWDRYELRLHKTASALVTEYSDIVGFAHYEAAVKKERQGFDKTRVRGIGDGSRVLGLEDRPGYVAKNRFGLPASIKFSAEDFMAAMRTSLKPPVIDEKPTAQQEESNG